MKKPHLILVFCFINILCLSAQDYQVSGLVKDGGNTPIPFANVFLLQVSDSTIVKGASANEQGFFSIESVSPSLYWISASYIGQASKLTAIDVQKDVKIGTLIIEENVESLDEVIVIAKKPVIERKVDRVVFNVENTVVSEGTTWDILKSTPGVIMVQDQLQIGSQTPSIYLNDRKVQLSQSEIKDLLEGFSGVNIKSIEIIINPPARYDAEGGPILNIITSKNVIPGYKGSINGNYTQAIYSKFNIGTSHYFKTKNLNVFANYSISPRKVNKRTLSTINYIDNSNTVFSIWDTDYNRVTKSLGHNANVILDYDINEKNTINFTSNLSYSPNKRFTNSLFGQAYNGLRQLDSVLMTNSAIENNTKNLAVDLTYLHNFDKEGASLSLNGHFTSYDETQTQGVSTDYFDTSDVFLRNNSFATDAAQDIEIMTLQADYITPIGGTIFETGAKASTIHSTSGIDFFNISGANQTFDPSLSDNFKYDESVLAGYVSILKNWEKWTLKAGTRGEYTDVKGTSLTLNVTNTQRYFELFPSAFVLYTPSDNHSFSFDYSRKLGRPRYDDLNPFRYFLYENDYTLGNPNLKSFFSHQFKLDYTLKGDYFFSIYYRDNGNNISTLSFQDNQNLNLQTLKQNVLESVSYGVDFTVSKSILNNWYVYSYTSLFYEDETFLAVESNDAVYTNKVEGVYFQLTNYLTFSKDGSFTGNLGYYYFSDFISGTYVKGKSSNLSFGLRKTLWKNRASISLSIEDILGKENTEYTSKYLNQNNSFSPITEKQYIRFGFNYKFGNFKLSDNERNIDKNERERL
ncbi:MAG: TonB-dependent receptor [Flavobacteriaceae bacterium]|nr:MAG: TonB-dependent receptor [Flavobacteriaceae bacterium]